MTTTPRAVDRPVSNAPTADGVVRSGAGREWLAPLRRWWWLPVVVGLVAAFLVASLAGTSVGRSTSAIVNTRASSSLPNERIDLINDLAVVLRVTEVVEAVAADTGLRPAAVRSSIAVTRVEASTLVRITVTTERGGDPFRREVVESFLRAAVAYLQPASPSRALSAAEEAERQAIGDYYAAIEANAGIPPTEELERLQERIVQAALDGDPARRAALTRKVPAMVDEVARFTELTSRRDRAIANARATSQSDLIAASGGIAALTPSFQDGSSDADSITSSVALRRGVAGGTAAALLVAALILVLGRARRLR